MTARALAMPLAALVLAAGLIGVHLAAGAADYKPLTQPNPCRQPPAGPKTTELEPLAEMVVLTGLQQTACRLGVSRVRLVLALPSQADRRRLARERGIDEAGLARALQAGLTRGIDQLARAGKLPDASQLLPSLLAEVDLPGLAEDAIRRIPDSLIDEFIPTAPVLKRSVAKLDVQATLEDIDDPDRLEEPIRDAVVDAVREEAGARLRAKLPGPLGDILGL